MKITPRKLKGTPHHKLQKLTSTVLGGLVEDLHQLEDKGYDDDVCGTVTTALVGIGKTVVHRASSPWMHCIALNFGDFHQAYVNWNGNGKKVDINAKANRRFEIERLKKVRSGWSSHVMENHRRHVGGVDEVAIFSDEAITLLSDIAESHPDYFKQLRSAIRKYRKTTKF